MKPIIEVKNISKKYSITHNRGGYIALRDTLAAALKKPFSFLARKSGLSKAGKKEIFWALKDINFSVEQGEVIGIIGHNGAGKSTLLKILSQITPPTTGEITLRGRVGSLLEVGTGFHPELTGRENIFLNGAILGMGRKEIAQKFNEIVEFAGIEKFLDTPVKYYSSGMYVRLAFSVAAHMDPEILIIDEVLAVGDAEFQKKCLGKMNEITKKEGRTILFVSHNLDAIRGLCKKAILLKNGQIEAIGETDSVIAKYMKQTVTDHGHGEVISSIKKIILKKISFDQTSRTFTVNIDSEEKIPVIRIGIGINAHSGERITTLLTDTSHEPLEIVPGINEFTCSLSSLPLKSETYNVDIMIGDAYEVFLFQKDQFRFTIDESPLADLHLDDSQGYLQLQQAWNKK